ncbi:MAG: hypothetical protein K6F03_05750 [Saccharofermentans sp.]|nr:hypothetical protein [Saccharofermentans sp.]
MTIYNPQLAELMNAVKNPPTIPALKSFGEICKAMRTAHDFYMLHVEQFEKIYSDTARAGKLTTAGLKEMRAEFEGAIMPVISKTRDMISNEIEKWKEAELHNTYATVNKAPTEEQARLLEVVLKKDSVSQAELEMLARNFGDNYSCACAFRDFAKKKGYMVAFSDFTDAEDRITDINGAYDYLNNMLAEIHKPSNSSYNLMAFYRTDENGESYEGSLARAYTEALDTDSTFKPQKIEVTPISNGEAS